MKVIYVAGPITAPTDWKRELNIREAESLALEIWKSGAVAICVHSQGRFFQGELPDESWVRGDLEILSRCDAVMLCAGWQWSAGTLAEIDFAQQRNIPVFGRLDYLKKWIKE